MVKERVLLGENAMAASTAAGIWDRLLRPGKGGLSPEAARSLLELQFSEVDHDRMNELAAKARKATLTASERAELEEYIRAGDVLALIKSRARQSLKRAKVTG